jgi:hypothetical protein
MQRCPLLLLLFLAACDGEVIGDTFDTGTKPPVDTGVEDSGMVVPDSGTPDTGPAMCVDLIVFADADGDQYGVSGEQLGVCLFPGEEQEGYAREAGDCKASDPWANPGATEICNDYYDDDCDSMDEACPTTNQAAIEVPQWDCISDPIPNNVYAYALFADGATYFQANGCFVFFEGLANEFYVQRVNLNRVSTAASCTQVSGCTCPSSPSYDRRMYAMTKSETVDPCTELSIVDHGGEMQAVSNDCRKFLYQLHYPASPPPPYSFIAGSLEAMERRIALYPTAEIVCAANPPNGFLPFVQLLSTTIEKNTGFVKK